MLTRNIYTPSSREILFNMQCISFVKRQVLDFIEKCFLDLTCSIVSFSFESQFFDCNVSDQLCFFNQILDKLPTQRIKQPAALNFAGRQCWKMHCLHSEMNVKVNIPETETFQLDLLVTTTEKENCCQVQGEPVNWVNMILTFIDIITIAMTMVCIVLYTPIDEAFRLLSLC